MHFLEIIYHGKNDQYHYIPVTVYQVKNDTVFAQKYIDEDMTTSIQMPMSQLAQPYIIYTTFYLGTDTIGRDILSKLLIGTWIGLAVGISLTIGIILGLLAGYFGEKTDALIMFWFINVIWSIPTLLLVFAVTLLLGKGFGQVFYCSWTDHVGKCCPYGTRTNSCS